MLYCCKTVISITKGLRYVENKTPEPPEDLQQIRAICYLASRQPNTMTVFWLLKTRSMRCVERIVRCAMPFEVEATARTEHDHTQNERLIAGRDAALTEPTSKKNRRNVLPGLRH